MENKQPDYSYQGPLLIKCIETLDLEKALVLAATCGAGKTNVSIDIIEHHFKTVENARVLVLTHGQTELRSQFTDRLRAIEEKRGSPFDFEFVEVLSSGTDIDSADALIAIPQTLRRKKDLKPVTLLIVDEAHHFYHSKSVQKLIEQIKPQYQLLLTATPSRFVADGKFKIICVSAFELLEYGILSDPTIELCHTNYDWGLDSYNADGELKNTYVFSKEQTVSSLDELFSHLKLQLAEKKPDVRDPTWEVLLQTLGKTIIACRNIKQACQIAEYFNSQKLSHVMSTSDNDPDCEAIKRFKSETDLRMLIVVNRAVLGFDMPDLANCIDLSGSMNPDKNFQLLSRVTRKSSNVENKWFIKIVPESLCYDFYLVMSMTVCLASKEYLETYAGNFKNTKVPVPKSLLNEIEKKGREKRDKSGLFGRLTGFNVRVFPAMGQMKEILEGSTLSSYAKVTYNDVRQMMKTAGKETQKKKSAPKKPRTDYKKLSASKKKYLVEDFYMKGKIPKQGRDIYSGSDMGKIHKALTDKSSSSFDKKIRDIFEEQFPKYMDDVKKKKLLLKHYLYREKLPGYYNNQLETCLYNYMNRCCEYNTMTFDVSIQRTVRSLKMKEMDIELLQHRKDAILRQYLAYGGVVPNHISASMEQLQLHDIATACCEKGNKFYDPIFATLYKAFSFNVEKEKLTRLSLMIYWIDKKRLPCCQWSDLEELAAFNLMIRAALNKKEPYDFPILDGIRRFKNTYPPGSLEADCLFVVIHGFVELHRRNAEMDSRTDPATRVFQKTFGQLNAVIEALEGQK